MQPYKQNGRFYNNKYDSILRRLKNFIRSFFYVIGHHVIRIFKKKQVQKIVDIGVGEVSIPVSTSIEPIITWLGHSTFLIQVAGINIITDPMFFGGLPIFSRNIPMPILPSQLPHIDIILVSHNHKDHLDVSSLKTLIEHDPLLLVPAGNSKWLARYGFMRSVEKTWWESETINQSISFTFLPAIHWTSRGLLDINTTLWGSWLIESPTHKIYFAGDTAYGEHFSMIAQRYGQIDVALMPIGPNEPRQFIADAHINAQEAVKAFCDLRANHFIPMHWGTFARMGAELHGDPLGLLKREWERYSQVLGGAQLHMVKCGQSRKFC